MDHNTKSPEANQTQPNCKLISNQCSAFHVSARDSYYSHPRDFDAYHQELKTAKAFILRLITLKRFFIELKCFSTVSLPHTSWSLRIVTTTTPSSAFWAKHSCFLALQVGFPAVQECQQISTLQAGKATGRSPGSLLLTVPAVERIPAAFSSEFLFMAQLLIRTYVYISNLSPHVNLSNLSDVNGRYVSSTLVSLFYCSSSRSFAQHKRVDWGCV